jgi:hypothetical protein
VNYGAWITLEENRKGVLDLDTTKGCESGMAATAGGCYGLCYAARAAKTRGLTFDITAVRHFRSVRAYRRILSDIRRSRSRFVRIGTSGDPSEAWLWTVTVCSMLEPAEKPVVVITKHWRTASDYELRRLVDSRVVLNTSVSALDTDAQRDHRLEQYTRFARLGGRSVLRVVTIDANLENEVGRRLADIQSRLLEFPRVIDNPLRAFRTSPLVRQGIIRLTLAPGYRGGRQLVSLHDAGVWLGTCAERPEQCGLSFFAEEGRP